MTTILFTSDEVGAPTLNNAAGSLISVLDACLINGFNVRSVSALVVAGGVATATVPSGHGYQVGRKILISGATPSELNGHKEVLTSGTTSVTFASTSPDGTATGTITAKRGPLPNWTKPFSGSNKAAYRATDPVVTSGLWLRVDDTAAAPAGAQEARVLICEGMTGIDTYTASAPTAAQLANGGHWWKGPNSASAARWALVGNEKRFWIFLSDGSNTGRGMFGGFGDLNTFKAGDVFHTFLCAAPNGGASFGGFGIANSTAAGAAPNNGNALWVARGHTGVGDSVTLGVVCFGVGSSQVGGQGPTYPSVVDNSVVFAKGFLVSENTTVGNYPFRGTFPECVSVLAAGASWPTVPVEYVTTDGSNTRIFVGPTASGVGMCAMSCKDSDW